MMNPIATLLFHLKAFNLPPPEAEYVFAADRRFAFDLAWPAQKLAVEADGGIFGIGPKCKLCGRRKVAGHSSIQRLLSDREKMNLAQELGWRVLCYVPTMIESGEAARQIRRVLLGVGPIGGPMAGDRDQVSAALTSREPGSPSRSRKLGR